MGIIRLQETIHSMKVTKKPGMVIKLDIEKAYDKSSLKYMKSTMESFGFGMEWVE